jgi:hypothetical protein
VHFFELLFVVNLFYLYVCNKVVHDCANTLKALCGQFNINSFARHTRGCQLVE